MPKWAHFPLILGPNGKLSKRDGAKYGFPVFAMNWVDPKTGELTEGFKEKGFLPEAFINLLALLGWNDGGEQEIFTKEELIQRFSMDRVHSAGAKFDFEKAKWFNHEWIKRKDPSDLKFEIERLLSSSGITVPDTQMLDKIIPIVKDRCTLLPDFVQQSAFFFQRPATLDKEAVLPKWNKEKEKFFQDYASAIASLNNWSSSALEELFKQQAAAQNIKAGELQLPFRVMLVGGKFGPPVFVIAEVLGKDETIARIENGTAIFSA
jgi:glutamyl-tRNA synthetase